MANRASQCRSAVAASSNTSHRHLTPGCALQSCFVKAHAIATQILGACREGGDLLALPEGSLRKAVFLLPGVCLGHAGALVLVPILQPRVAASLAAAAALSRRQMMPGRFHAACARAHYVVVITVFNRRISCEKWQDAPANKLQVKAAKILPLVGLPRSNQDPVECGLGTRCFYRALPARGERTPNDDMTQSSNRKNDKLTITAETCSLQRGRFSVNTGEMTVRKETGSAPYRHPTDRCYVHDSDFGHLRPAP